MVGASKGATSLVPYPLHYLSCGPPAKREPLRFEVLEVDLYCQQR
jgi:hypothetical protein